MEKVEKLNLVEQEAELRRQEDQLVVDLVLQMVKVERLQPEENNPGAQVAPHQLVELPPQQAEVAQVAQYLRAVLAERFLGQAVSPQTLAETQPAVVAVLEEMARVLAEIQLVELEGPLPVLTPRL